MKNYLGLKILVSSIAAIGLIVHLIWPTINIDAIAFGFFVVIILPWLSPLIKSIKLPSGLEISLQDVKTAGEKVSSSITPEQAVTLHKKKPEFQEVLTKDPNLLLVALRIEIEKRLVALGEKHGIKNERSLIRLLRILHSEDIVDNNTYSGLSELISAGNQAAHGANVQESVSTWALDVGPQILYALDSRLNELDLKNYNHWFDNARRTILSHGDDFVALCRTLLDLAVKDNFVHISSTSDKKLEAAQILTKLGALEELKDRPDKYKLTDVGYVLQQHL